MLRVLSTNMIDHINYKIIGSSGYIESKSVKFSKSLEYFLEIIPSTSMGSSIQVIVFYITEDGELVSDSTEISLDGNYANYVSKELFKMVRFLGLEGV